MAYANLLSRLKCNIISLPMISQKKTICIEFTIFGYRILLYLILIYSYIILYTKKSKH